MKQTSPRKTARGSLASATRRRRVQTLHHLRQLAVADVRRAKIVVDIADAREMIASYTLAGINVEAQARGLDEAEAMLADIDRTIASHRRAAGIDPVPTVHVVPAEIAESLDAAGLHEFRS